MDKKIKCDKLLYIDRKILIAEDEPKLLKALVHIFELNNYVVDGVLNGEDAYNYALTNDYDGLILDIMMPKMDGLEVIKKLRENNIKTPALFLTAKTEVYQRVEGLDAGADDYLSKPFYTKELLARVRAMMRRKDNYTPNILSFNHVKLNPSTFEIIYDNNKQTLSTKEYQVLELLFTKPKIIVPTEKFITHIWGWDTNVDTSVVWVHISNIRKKLESINAPIIIKFIRSAGYMLEEVNND